MAVSFQIGWLHTAWDRLPPVEEKDSHRPDDSLNLRQFGQYHGAGVVTGIGLRFLRFAHRYRLPLLAVLGRTRLPVLSRFSPIEHSYLPPKDSHALLTSSPGLGFLRKSIQVAECDRTRSARRVHISTSQGD
jgi:hypothetical protein